MSDLEENKQSMDPNKEKAQNEMSYDDYINSLDKDEENKIKEIFWRSRYERIKIYIKFIRYLS